MDGKERQVKSIFHSICWKLSVRMVIPALAAMIFFVWLFTGSLKKNAVELYERQTESSFGTSIKNIDYYIASCVSSSKSVYINDALLTIFRKADGTPYTSAQRELIFSYLKTVYYSISKAKQIYLAIPQAQASFLYITDNLTTSTAYMELTEDSIPVFTDWRDVVIEPTHFIGAYGHVVGFGNVKNTTMDNLVFTIWLPVYNLPYTNSLAAYMAIDMPIEFIMENCQLAYDEMERVYVVDSEGGIIASSDEVVINRNISEICQSVIDLDEDKFDSLVDGENLIMQEPLDSQYVKWRIVKTVPLESIYNTIWKQGWILLIFVLIVLVLVMGINIVQVLHFLIPIRQTTAYMSLIVRSKSWRNDVTIHDYVTYEKEDEIGILVETVAIMMKSINDYAIRQLELELAYARSMLRTLQAQINPHFIYNTLQCFATNALKSNNPEQYHLLSSFGQMLHYTMVLEPLEVAFSKEIEYVERYVKLQRMRFSSDGDVHFYVDDDAKTVLVPKMILQPVVENSFIHGKLFRKVGGILNISATVKNGTMTMKVEDNGIAISVDNITGINLRIERMKKIYTSPAIQNEVDNEKIIGIGNTWTDAAQEHGIGLENVYTRLLLSHKVCEFKIYANEIGGTTTEVTFLTAGQDGLRKDNE